MRRIHRHNWMSLLKRMEAIVETADLLTDREAVRKLRESSQDAESGRGITVEEAERLLGFVE